MKQHAFSWWDQNGFLEYHNNNVRIYNVDGEQYLFIDQIMYASSTERSWYIKNVMPHAHGRCLEVGLGLGIASKVILARPEVEYLLTIENSEPVIAAYGKPLHRHFLLCADIYEWANNYGEFDLPLYDLIFVDHYTAMEDELIDELTPLVENLKKLLRPEGKLIVWVDESLAPEDTEMFRKLWVV